MIMPPITKGFDHPILEVPYGMMPYVSARSKSVRPTAKVPLPSQSIFCDLSGADCSLSFKYAQTVPRMPKGTLTRNTSRQ